MTVKIPAKTEASCSDCADISIRVDEARRRILSAITPISGASYLPLRDALEHVLEENICSPFNVPGHTNSAMDGYAVNAAGLSTQHPAQFKVIGAAYAGKPFNGHCNQQQSVRIMTGAVIPSGTDTVVMQEHTELLQADHIRIGTGHKTGQNIRQIGEDIAIGSKLFSKGDRLTPADLGLLSSMGIGELKVKRRLRVAIFSTGDELRSVGQILEPGQIYDSNRYSLFGMLDSLGVEIIDLGVVPDNPQALRETFRSALAGADVVITSGGVSVGDADYVKEIMTECGDIGFWKIAMKPGRPLAFGHLGETLFFGLPGNPVAVMVSFLQFVKPALHYMETGHPYNPLIIKATARCEIRKRAGRFEFQRGIVTCDEGGHLTVTTTGRQGAGILTSMGQANCFILLNEENTGISEGDLVDIQILNYHY